MQMYLTAKPSGERLQIPLLPDALNVRTSAATIASQIINIGEIKMPRGTNLIGYSWNGTLPGESMRQLPFVSAWQEPRKIIATIEEWLKNGQTIAFMVTEATINQDVFVESFNYEYKGRDQVTYNIALTMKRALTVKTVPPPPAPATPSPTPSGPRRSGTVRLSNPNGTAPVLYEPKAGARIIAMLKHNTKVTILGQTGGYYIIEHAAGRNRQGYILMRYLTVDPAPTAPSKVQPSRPGRPWVDPGRTNTDKTGKTTITTKPFETIADIARRTYNSNSMVKLIVDANKPLLTKVANTAKSILGTIKSGLKLVVPNAKPNNVKPSPTKPRGGGGGGRATMMKY